MKGDCNICVNRKLPSDSATCVDCGLSRKNYKPLTNADRIRAMTDEELAWELARICRMPFYKDDSEIDEYEVDCWAKWLKQEATDGETETIERAGNGQ